MWVKLLNSNGLPLCLRALRCQDSAIAMPQAAAFHGFKA
jgi:hypothetical protein